MTAFRLLLSSATSFKNPVRDAHFTVARNTLFQGKETQGDFLQEVLESGGDAVTEPMEECFTSPSRPSKTKDDFQAIYPPRFYPKLFLSLKPVYLNSKSPVTFATF